MIKDKRLKTKENYLLYLEEVPKHKFACKAVLISEDTGKRWRDDDSDFSDQCEARIAAWVNKTLKRTKPEFQLERLMREDFAQRIEATDKDYKSLPTPILGGLSQSVQFENTIKFIDCAKK